MGTFLHNKRQKRLSRTQPIARDLVRARRNKLVKEWKRDPLTDFDFQVESWGLGFNQINDIGALSSLARFDNESSKFLEPMEICKLTNSQQKYFVHSLVAAIDLVVFQKSQKGIKGVNNLISQSLIFQWDLLLDRLVELYYLKPSLFNERALYSEKNCCAQKLLHQILIMPTNQLVRFSSGRKPFSTNQIRTFSAFNSWQILTALTTFEPFLTTLHSGVKRWR